MSRLDQLLNFAKSPRIEPTGFEAKTPWVSTDNAMSTSTRFFIHFGESTNMLTQDDVLDIVLGMVLWSLEEKICHD